MMNLTSASLLTTLLCLQTKARTTSSRMPGQRSSPLPHRKAPATPACYASRWPAGAPPGPREPHDCDRCKRSLRLQSSSEHSLRTGPPTPPLRRRRLGLCSWRTARTRAGAATCARCTGPSPATTAWSRTLPSLTRLSLPAMTSASLGTTAAKKRRTGAARA